MAKKAVSKPHFQAPLFPSEETRAKKAPAQEKQSEKQMERQKSKPRQKTPLVFEIDDQNAYMGSLINDGSQDHFEVFDEEIPHDTLPPSRPEPELKIKLSVALHRKLINQAEDEGICLESLVQEMLAESVVLRAWEIAERKSAMRGGHLGMSQGHPNRNYNNFNAQRHQPAGINGNHHPANNLNTSHPNTRYPTNPYRRSNTNNNAWMEDKAAFLEYVRNQEKRDHR